MAKTQMLSTPTAAHRGLVELAGKVLIGEGAAEAASVAFMVNLKVVNPPIERTYGAARRPLAVKKQCLLCQERNKMALL